MKFIKMVIYWIGFVLLWLIAAGVAISFFVEDDQVISAAITVIVAIAIHLFWRNILGVKKKPQKAVADDEKAAPEEPVSATAATPPSISDTGVFKLGEKDTNKEGAKVFLFYLQALHEEEFSDDADGRFACACHHVEEFVQAIEARAVEGSHFVIVSSLLDEEIEAHDPVDYYTKPSDKQLKYLNPNLYLSNETPQTIIPVSKIEQLREYTDQEKDSDDIKELFHNEAWFIVTVTESHVHQWDYNFLKASSMYGGCFTACGPHPKHEFARQIYDNGEYDTGIQVATDDLVDSYTQASDEQLKFLNPNLYLSGDALHN